MSQMRASKSVRHPKIAFVSPTVRQDPLQKNWYGSSQAISLDCTRTLLCVSPGGLCSAISRSNDSVQHTAQVAKLRGKPSGVFLLLLDCTNLIKHHNGNGIACSHPYRLPEHKKKSGLGGTMLCTATGASW